MCHCPQTLTRGRSFALRLRVSRERRAEATTLDGKGHLGMVFPMPSLGTKLELHHNGPGVWRQRHCGRWALTALHSPWHSEQPHADPRAVVASVPLSLRFVAFPVQYNHSRPRAGHIFHQAEPRVRGVHPTWKRGKPVQHSSLVKMGFSLRHLLATAHHQLPPKFPSLHQIRSLCAWKLQEMDPMDLI